jgi:hypothetical protein
VKHSETVLPNSEKSRRSFFSPLWQADNTKIARMAPIEFIGRYLGDGFFDYGIADEVHELKGSSAQGNALGTIAAARERTVILTGTLLGGYADDLFQILYRTNPSLMRSEGFDPGESGVRQFADAYGVLERVTTIEAAENACSKAKVMTTVKRRPGASPLLFGKYLMNMAAFVSLEDISDALPPYREEVLSVEMDPVLKEAYSQIEDDIREAIREHPGNASVISTAMNALLQFCNLFTSNNTVDQCLSGIENIALAYWRNPFNQISERILLGLLRELETLWHNTSPSLRRSGERTRSFKFVGRSNTSAWRQPACFTHKTITSIPQLEESVNVIP